MTTDSFRQPPLTIRILIVFAGTVTIWTLMRWVSSTFGDDELTIPTRFMNALLVCGLAVPMVIAARRHLDHRPFADLGLESPRRAWQPFLVGVAAFVVPSALGLRG